MTTVSPSGNGCAKNFAAISSDIIHNLLPSYTSNTPLQLLTQQDLNTDSISGRYFGDWIMYCLSAIRGVGKTSRLYPWMFGSLFRIATVFPFMRTPISRFSTFDRRVFSKTLEEKTAFNFLSSGNFKVQVNAENAYYLAVSLAWLFLLFDVALHYHKENKSRNVHESKSFCVRAWVFLMQKI